MEAMATSAAPALQREDWLRAAIAAFARGGVDAVRVEVIANALGVTKGSFYWHFRDRPALLDAILAEWEGETRWLVAEARQADGPRARLERFFELVAENRGYPPDVEILAWARHDPAVAARVEATERMRLDFIRGELRASGIAAVEADRRAKAAYLATQGYVEWVSRGVEGYASLPAFTRHLFGLVLTLPGRDA
jgi:AcrR family transcriptional regulator